MRWLDWGAGADALGKHWKGKCIALPAVSLTQVIHQDASIFEAVHGSAPDIAGRWAGKNSHLGLTILFFVRQGLGQSNRSLIVLTDDAEAHESQ